MVGQGIVYGIFGILSGRGQLDELFRPAVMLASLVIHDAPAQRLVGDILLACSEGGVDVEATRVGLVAVLRKDQLTRHFRHVLGVHSRAVRIGADLQIFLFGFLGLRSGDEAVFLHPLNDVELAHARTFRVADGVVGRRGLG